MKPQAFAYHRPGTLGEALELLEAHPFEAKPLAGGQSLVPAMNFRLATPAMLVDLNRVPDLDRIEAGPDRSLRLGAMTRQRAVERSALAAQAAPLLLEALPHVAHPQIRNRGTVGGSLAHADPSAELPAVMVALDARFRCRSRRGERWIPAAEFFLGLFATALEPGELLVEIEVPRAVPRTGWAFEEAARRHGDYALAGVAVVVALAGDGTCRSARAVLFGVGEGPVVARHLAAALEGCRPDEATIAAAAAALDSDLDPPSDIHATGAYRRHLSRVLVRRALARAFARSGGPA